MINLNKGYKAWNINEKDFPDSGSVEEKIKFILNYAILSPSSHNTQPWKFKISPANFSNGASGNSLEIFADSSRRLKISDKDGRMIFISVGCALTNILITADYFGLNYEVFYGKKADGFKESAARILFSEDKEKKKNNAALFNEIPNRSTNRNPYKDIPVSEEFLESLKKFNAREETAVEFISGTELKEKISDVMAGGMKRIMGMKIFRRELADWLRTNLTLKHDGMPGDGHNMNLFTSIIAPYVLRNIDVSEVEKQKAKRRVLNFPALGIIGSKEDNVLNWIYAGELFQNLILAVKSNKMDIAIMVAIIEDPESRSKLQKTLNFPHLPQMFFGFGYAEKPAPKSPRRKLEEFLL